MAISEKSIISPDPVKAGIPISRSTIVGIVILLAVLALVSAFVFQDSTPVTKKVTAEARPGQSLDAGIPSTIDEEERVAKGLPSRFEQPTNAVTNPIPASVRRGDSSAAMYENTFAKGTPTPITSQIAVPPNSVIGANSEASATAAKRLARDVEAEAQARTAKVLAYDNDSGASGSSSFQTNSVQNLAQLLGGTPSQAGGFSQSEAPSAALNPAIENALSQLKAAQVKQPAVANDRAWLNEYANENVDRKKEVTRGVPTASPFTLHQGKVIPATLARKINSDLPGQITAVTTTDVYDSMGMGALLIPKGSSLVGRYNSEVRSGQERLMFAFNRLIMPDGTSFDLPGAQGADLAGASGVEGEVNNHFFKMFTTSFFVAWLADRVQQPQTSSNSTAPATTTTSPAGQVLVDVSRTILDRNRLIPPTITIDQGTRINIEVARDMEFSQAYKRSKS